MNEQLIEKIYQAGSLWSLAITGGGTSAISELFGVAGASSTVIEAYVPYHAIALADFLGVERASSAPGCNASTARALAMQSYLKAKAVSDDKPCFGLGCTAAIATNRARKGADRCHITIQGDDKTWSLALSLDKSQSRQQQEAICANAIISSMATSLGIECEPIWQTDSKVEATVSGAIASASWQALLKGEAGTTASGNYAGIFPGAFNPMHAGHQAILDCAARHIDGDIALEISIRNVDKPPLDYLSMRERVEQTMPHETVFTNAPTFVEKSALFPGATFIVGVDTITRIAETKYYPSETARDDAIRTMADRGNRFLVFGRLDDDQFETLESTELLPALRRLCTGVNEDEFRIDLSSTELRSAAMPAKKP